MGADYWQPLLDFLRDRMVQEGTIDAEDFDRLVITDSASAAAQHIAEVALERFGLTYGPRVKRRWWLLEDGLGRVLRSSRGGKGARTAREV
jgi:hypothetical protein